LDLESKSILEIVQSYFRYGKVITKLSDNTVRYRVINRKDLINIILPHFRNYSVSFNKLHAFKLFSQILELLLPGKRDLKQFIVFIG